MPATARSCCSNWLVTQASIVWWPELCGRGAISLTRIFVLLSEEKLDSEGAYVVEGFGNLLCDFGGLRSDFPRDASRGNCDVKNLIAVDVLADREVDEAPILPTGSYD